MNRRLFFRAFAGAPIAVAKPSPAPAHHVLITGMNCPSCGASMMAYNHDAQRMFFVCPWRACLRYNVPVKAVSAPVEAASQDAVRAAINEEHSRRAARRKTLLFELADAEEFEKGLATGECWTRDPEWHADNLRKLRERLREHDAEPPLRFRRG